MAETTNTAEILIVADASGVEAGLRQATTAADRAERQMTNGANNSARSQGNLIAAIQRTTAQMESGSRTSSRYFEILAQQRGVNPQALEPYLRQLRAMEQAQQRAGQSAGQTRAAFQQLPAQLTDVIVSLQGGQNALTVMLQQGGQLRDSFGGAGAAVRALGSQVLGMISPLSVAAVVAGGLAFAYATGAKESRAYETALAATGNVAGLTANQMSDAARQVAAFSGTQGEAAKVVNQLVATGKVSADNLVLITREAIAAQRDLGREVGDTVKEFADLGKSPAQALRELNERYHLITAATYSQVKALEEQGRKAEAANLAQQAYAEGIAGQRFRVLESLTDWERGWIRIKKAASDAVDGTIDALVNLGRQETGQKKITSLLGEREQLEKNLLLAQQRRDTYLERSTRAALDANLIAINAERDRERAAVRRAEEEGRTAKAEELRIRIRDESGKLLSREKQLENALTAARTEATAAGLKEAEIQKYLALVRNEYKDVDEAAQKKREAAAKAAAEALKKEAGLLAELAGLTPGFAEDWERLSKAYAKGGLSLDQLTKAQADLLAKQPGIKKANDDQVKALAESDKLYEQGIKTAEQYRATLLEQVKAQRDSNEQIGLTGPALSELVALRLESAAAQKEETAAALEAEEPGGRVAQIYRDQAQALRDLAEAKREGAVRQASVDSAKQAAEDWKRASQDIERSLTDALLRGFESGKSFGQNLVDTLKNMFSTLVLRPIIQAAVQPMANQITGFMQGGGSGTGQQVAGGISSLSSLFGSTTAGKGVAGGASSALGGIASYGGWIAAGMALADGLYKKGWDPNNGTVSKGMIYTEPLTGSSTILNEVFKALGMNNKLANLFSGASITSALFGRKNPEIESQGIQGTFGGSGFSGEAYANILEKGGLFRSDKRYVKTAGLSSDQDASFDATYKALVDAAKGFASTLGIEAGVIDGYNKQIKLQLGADEAKNQETIAKLFGDIGDELSLRLVPNLASFAQAGEATSATLQRLVTGYATVDEALNAIGMQFGAVGVQSIEARERLLAAAGGLEAFAANTAGFQQTFLSEQERNAPVLKAVTEQLAALGLAGVDTRDEFKQVVLGLDLTTEAGAKQYGSLIKLQSAFAQVYPAIEDTAVALAQVNKGYQEQIDGLLRERMSPEERRATDTAGMDASTIALYDRLEALKLEAASLEALRQQSETIAAERRTLQDELDDLTLSAAEKLKKQRDALDASNQAIFDQIQAVRAQQSAAQQAAAAIKAAAESSAAAVSSFGNAVLAAMERATASAKSMRDFADSLKLGSLSTLDPEARYREAKKQFDAADPSNTQAAQAFLQASKDRGGDSFYYERDFALVQEKLAKGAKALDDYAARLPDFYRGYAAMLNPALAITNPAPVATQPATSYAAQTMSKASAQQADFTRLEAKVDALASIGDTMQEIAQSTADTAKYIGKVTDKGAAMRVGAG